MTCTPTAGKKMLSTARMGSLVKSIDCSDPKNLKVTFSGNDAVAKAKSSWAWADKAGNDFAFVVDGKCGGQYGRQSYMISKVTYQANAPMATLSGQPAKWEDFLGNYEVHITNKFAGNPSARGIISSIGNGIKGVVGDIGNVDKQGSLNLARADLSGKQLFSGAFKGVQVSAICAECGLTGSLDFDIKAGLTVPNKVQAIFTSKNGVGAQFALGLTIAGELTDPYNVDFKFPTIPVATFGLGPLGDVGINLDTAVTGGIGAVQAEVNTKFGAGFKLPDGQQFGIGAANPSFDPQFFQIGPDINGKIAVSANVNPLVALSLGVSLPKIGGVTAGLSLEAPQVTADITAIAGNDQAPCGDANAIGSVNIDINAGLSIKAFAGVGAATDLPNAKTLFTKSKDVFNACVKFGQKSSSSGSTGSGSTGSPSTGSGTTQPPAQPQDGSPLSVGVDGAGNGFNGNNGKRPLIGTVTYNAQNGHQAVSAGLFNSGANSDDTPIEPIAKGQTISQIKITSSALASCALFSGFDQTKGCGTFTGTTLAPNSM